MWLEATCPGLVVFVGYTPIKSSQTSCCNATQVGSQAIGGLTREYNAYYECTMQVRMSEYNQLKGQVTAAARKQTGSLAVRDLTGLVSEEDAVNTENLLSLFTVVSKHDKNEWLSTYETLSDFVVSLTLVL